MTTLNDAYRHLMSAAASAREARDALAAAAAAASHKTAHALRERHRMASDLESAIERLDELTARVEQALRG